MSRLLIIDVNALIHRSFHALPKLTSPHGKEIQGVYGFCLVFLKILKLFKPDYIVAAFDLPHPTFRHKQYKYYKATRVRAPQELYDQIPLVKEFLNYVNVPVLERSGYEADDLIGSIVNKFKKTQDIEIVILTGDLDTLQLVNQNTKVCTFKKGITDNILYDVEGVRARFGGVNPDQLVDFKGLKGDVSDNVPGVKGIGEKTAIELIKKFGTLENLFSILEKGIHYWESLGLKRRLYDILQNQKKIAIFSRELVKIRTDLDIKLNLKTLSVQKIDFDSLKKFFYGLGFKSLIARLNELTFNKGSADIPGLSRYNSAKAKKEEKEINIKPEAFLREIKKTKKFFCSLGQNSLIFKNIKNRSLVIGLNGTSINRRLLNLLSETEFFKITDEYSKLFNFMLKTYNQEIRGPIFDFTIAAYLLDPGAKQYPMEALFYKYLNRVGTVFLLHKKLEAELEKQELKRLYQEIELPLVRVLAYMSRWGCKIDRKYLETLKVETQEKLKLIEKEIFKISGIQINLNSPRQIAWLLFEKMNLPKDGMKKTKEGQISTALKYLMKLRGSFKIVDLILEYREIDKLLTTYINPISEYTDKSDSRIHPIFNQIATATGRLSCEMPNLQALPQKSEIQNRIRKAFEAPAGYKLISFDYSQIELRIIASLSGEPKLIEFFKEDKDVHTLTAALIFKKPENHISEIERRIAKTINFGIIYGLSSYGLAKTLLIPYEEAQRFIDSYFKQYPKIYEFIRSSVEQTKALGYNETIFGRRRYIPEIRLNSETLVKQGERMAVNFPIQGSQADIIKKAMVEIFERLRLYYKEEARMILQIHDELVFEVKEERVDEFVVDIKRIMEETVLLKVPIKVNVACGFNLAQLSVYEPKTLL